MITIEPLEFRHDYKSIYGEVFCDECDKRTVISLGAELVHLLPDDAARMEHARAVWIIAQKYARQVGCNHTTDMPFPWDKLPDFSESA